MKPRQILSVCILGPAITYAVGHTVLYNCTNKNNVEARNTNNNIDNAIKLEGNNAKASFILLQKSDNKVQTEENGNIEQ